MSKMLIDNATTGNEASIMSNSVTCMSRYNKNARMFSKCMVESMKKYQTPMPP